MTTQDALPLTWPQRYGRDDFIVADCNKKAFEAVMNPDEWPIPITLIMGQIASGKTHLSSIFKEQHDAVLLANEADIDHALSSQPSYLLIDDADKIQADEKLFHLFNSVLTRKARFLMTATNEPQEWIALPDLLSRVKASHYITLEAPDETMIKFGYQKLFNDRGLFVDDKVLDYLTLRSERSFSSVLKTVDQLDHLALQNKKRVTIPLITDSGLFA